MKSFQNGKRYWFRNGKIIYSGIYNEINCRSEECRPGCVVLVRKNGDQWLIKKSHVFSSKEKAIKGLTGYIITD